MGAEWRADTHSSWPPFSSPDVQAGDIGVLLSMENDSRQVPETPTWDGDTPTEVADSGDGGSRPGRVKIFWLKPSTGVTNIAAGGGNQNRYVAIVVKGADSADPYIQKFEGRAHGTGSLYATLNNVKETSICISGCNAEQTDLHLDSGETVIDDYQWDHDAQTAYKQASAGTHTFGWDWAAGSSYAGACTVEFKGAAGGPRMIVTMFERLRSRWLEHQARLGVADLGGFERGADGLWKPKERLATI